MPGRPFGPRGLPKSTRHIQTDCRRPHKEDYLHESHTIGRVLGECREEFRERSSERSAERVSEVSAERVTLKG